MESNWNFENQIPLRLWLVNEREEHHDERMQILGNLVVPSCAALGMELIVSFDRELSAA